MYANPADKAAAELARYHQRRGEARTRLGGRCVACGATNDLQFDHIDPATKTLDVGKLWSVNRERFLAEIAKCQLLCRSCHASKTSVERSVPHGGGVSGKRGCKCEPCRLKKNEYLRALKRERRARGLKD